jgi:beta-galactosidase
VYLKDTLHATLQPQREQFPHLPYPPFLVDLDLDGSGRPELRIDGIVGGQVVLSRAFSADDTQDQLLFQADDASLIADGADATRLVFGRTDRHGSVRAFATGSVSFQIRGPAELVGDNPFLLADAGGIGAVWLKTIPGRTGTVEVLATHSELGAKSQTIAISEPPGPGTPAI